MSVSEQQSERQPGGAAIRLTFAYEGDTVRLVSRDRVAMLVPPSDELSGFAGQDGFAAEVREAGGSLVYRRVLAHPMPDDVEVFSDEPGQSIMRVPVERPAGLFVVVVPDSQEADHFALTGTLPSGAAAADGPMEIIRVPLGDTGRGGRR
jgi:hypothetical protein